MNTSTTPSVASPISTHRYNGLHWRIAKHWHARPDAQDKPDRKVTYWYDSAWRVIQEDHVDQINEAGTLEETVIQQFWGERYIDDAVARLRLAPSSTILVPAPSATEDITFQLTDVQFSVIALAAPGSPSVVIDRISYTPYGEPTRRLRSDVDGNGAVDSSDYGDIIQPLIGTPITSPAYRVEADLDRNGTITLADYNICIADEGRKVIGGGGVGETDLFSPGVRNSVGYCGYIHNEDTGLYTVRYRTYSATLGRWLTRDPAGYVDSMNSYKYVVDNPLSFLDPLGLQAQEPEDKKQTKPAAPTKCQRLIDDLERQWSQVVNREDNAIAIFDLAAMQQFELLSDKDKGKLGIFNNIQSCILSDITKCSNCYGRYNSTRAKWVTDVVRDFMRPYVTALCERASGVGQTDPGWALFFKRLDGGEFKSTLIPPVALEFEIARQMALNHINSDLFRSLMKNGRGGADAWRCIGDVVDACQRKVSTGFLQPGADLAGKIWDMYDIQKIRDQMRRRVPVR